MMQVLKEGPEVVYVCVLLCKGLTMKLARTPVPMCIHIGVHVNYYNCNQKSAILAITESQSSEAAQPSFHASRFHS